MYITPRVCFSWKRSLLKVCGGVSGWHTQPPPRVDVPLRDASVCPEVFAEGSVPPVGLGDRERRGRAEGHRQNYSQAPNTAVEISHDLPNSTFYIL